MRFVEKQIAEYESLDIPQTKRYDFDAFWEETVALVMSRPLNAQSETVDYPIEKIEVRDVTYEGLDGTPIHAWLVLPPEYRDQKVPAVVRYHGASSSRGLPIKDMPWLMLGFAVVAPDFRMQGGMTGSNTGFRGGAGTPSNFSWGLNDKKDYYFYHAWTDCLRAIELALATAEIDGERIAVEGGSQGGAASLAMAALHPEVALCMADVPSNCWLEKRLFDRAGGMNNVAEYLRRHPGDLEKVCETLSYFDNINLVDRITCPVQVSCGLKDPVCPPSNVYAAYNKITSDKRIIPYPFAEHDGGRERQAEKNLEFAREHLLW